MSSRTECFRSLKWQEAASSISRTLEALEFRDSSGELFAIDTGFAKWSEMAGQVRQTGRSIFLIGNGASSSIASHFAADLAKNGHVRTQVFSDAALLSAVANDLGVRHLFSEPLRRSAGPGDLLVVISSSGASPNLLDAVDIAHSLETEVVTVSAMAPDNPLRNRGDLNAWLPAENYGLAETCHAAILHHWMDLVEIQHKSLEQASITNGQTT